MSVFEPVHRLFNNVRLRKTLLLLRVPLGLAAAAAVVWHAQPRWFWLGLGVSAFGAIFQWWCFGCIMTSKELAVRGPYMLMRNPMYIARLFLVLGIVLMTGNWLLVIALVVMYYFYMVNRVKREEVKLAGIFGVDYTRYCQDVRRFLPTLPRSNLANVLHFELRCFNRNHGIPNLVLVLLAYAFLYWWVLIRTPPMAS